MPWILYLAAQSPLLSPAEATIRQVGENRFEVSVGVSNTGFLPTNLTDRGIKAEVIKPVVAVISIEGGRLVEGSRRAEVGHLAGSYPVPDPDRPSSGGAKWIVEATSPPATVQVEVHSQKGGVRRTGPLALRPPD